jgi:hypothetical protein
MPMVRAVFWGNGCVRTHYPKIQGLTTANPEEPRFAGYNLNVTDSMNRQVFVGAAFDLGNIKYLGLNKLACGTIHL